MSIGRMKSISIAVLVTALCSMVLMRASHAESLNLRVLVPGGALEYLTPDRVSNTFTHGLQGHVFQTLTRVSPDGTVEGSLATSWEPTEDKLGWIFRLREGISFTDGKPFNAEAVVVNIKHLVNRDTIVPQRGNLGTIAGAEAIDEYTVKITTSAPFSGMPIWLSHGLTGMVSPGSFEAFGAELPTSPAAGTGPFAISEHRLPEHVLLRRNEGYWGEKPNVESIDLRAVQNDQTRLAALLSGDADVIFYIDAQDIARVQSSGAFKAVVIPSIREFLVHLPVDRPEMGDVRVRQALNYAIDRDAIISQIYQGTAAVADAPVGAGVVGYQPVAPYTYDLDKAAALLAEAGWVKNAAGVLERDGQPFPTLVYNASNGRYPSDAVLAQAVSGYLSAIGVPNQIGLLEPATFLSNTYENAYREGWLTQLAWGFPMGDGAAMLCQIYIPGSRFNFGGYSNPRLNDTCAAVNDTFDIEERTNLMKGVSEDVYRDAPAIFIVNLSYAVAMRADLEGIVVSPAEFHRLSDAHER